MQYVIWGGIFSALLLLPIFTSAIITESEESRKKHYIDCFLSMLCGCILTVLISIAFYCKS